MNGIYNPIIFYPSAVLIILFAILAIGTKDIFRSLLCAIVVFFLTGMFFYVLGSEYNAVIQIAIYGVAVPIVLGLAVMFTNYKNKSIPKSSNKNYLIFLTSGLFILTSVYLILTSIAIIPNDFNFSEQIGGTTIQVLSAISNGIFVKYVWAFEIVSLILTIIVVGLALINNKKGGENE